MSSNSDIADEQADPDQYDASDTDPHVESPSFELRSVVVNYERRPDRRTVYPVGLPDLERMSTWLTADDDAFVNLDESR